ncbi:hemophore-related protein [Nocardia rhizosphaerihabitans]|uniref:hemophore-related protein n=1 Tax=Nocardia rhizosphaerihabitans TaxID=1691570 RepID=UPI00367295B4
MKWNHLSTRTALTIGLAALATATTVGTASAAPGDRTHPMLETTCSVEQIEAALAEHAPDLAQKLAQHPEHRAKLAELLAKSPEERRVVIQQRQGEHPGRHGGSHEGQHTRMLEVLEVCATY